MADRADDKPQRSAADKERSRQQSRAVSGKEAARTVGRSNRPGQRTERDDRRTPQGRNAQAGTQQGRSTQQGRKTQSGQGAQQRRNAQAGRPGKPGRTRAGSSRPAGRRPVAGRNRPRGAPPRSRTALFTWSAVLLVVVVVGILLAVNLGSSKTASNRVTPEPVPASIMSAVTHVKASVFNAVGTGSAAGVRPPSVESGPPTLKLDGKPGVFYMGGEFCPFCAAERWGVIAALSRFGSISGVKTMASASTDVYPSTQTFTFATARYTSKYIGTTLLETFGQNAPTGKHTVLKQPSGAENKLLTKYDKSTSATSSGSIPFIDVGNKVVWSGASYTPQLLQGLTRTQIAGDLSHATNPVTKAIAGLANYLSAAICSIDNSAPSSVCSSAGVQAAAKALGINA